MCTLISQEVYDDKNNNSCLVSSKYLILQNIIKSNVKRKTIKKIENTSKTIFQSISSKKIYFYHIF